MVEFAEAPNVAVKISGLGEPGQAWAIERNHDIVLETIRIFGEDRCMLVSNFPVDSLVGSPQMIYAGFIQMTGLLGRVAQEKLFSGNAQRIYRIPAGQSHG